MMRMIGKMMRMMVMIAKMWFDYDYDDDEEEEDQVQRISWGNLKLCACES